MVMVGWYKDGGIVVVMVGWYKDGGTVVVMVGWYKMVVQLW